MRSRLFAGSGAAIKEGASPATGAKLRNVRRFMHSEYRPRDIVQVMKILAVAVLLVSGAFGQTQDQDVTGRWSGTADTTDEAGTKRQEKQTLEIRKEGGKLTGNRVDKNGKAGLALEVQQAGAKVKRLRLSGFRRR